MSTVWVAQKLPVYTTARAAISIDVLRLIVRGQRTGAGPHQLEEMLRDGPIRASVIRMHRNHGLGYLGVGAGNASG